MTWAIDKQFSFCYGHRVWSQQLQKEFCESGDTSTKCRFMHGHEATVHVFLESESLERGMVTDFKHLGWLNTFFNNNLDHKFILDLNDPWFNNITGIEPIWTSTSEPNNLSHFKSRRPLNTSEDIELNVLPVYVTGEYMKHLVGYKVDVSGLMGPEREFLEGFFFTTFLPTSEHFALWIYKMAEFKMKPLNVQVSRVDWFETPKSRSSYSETNK